jgi:hypothetical protein
LKFFFRALVKITSEDKKQPKNYQAAKNWSIARAVTVTITATFMGTTFMGRMQTSLATFWTTMKNQVDVKKVKKIPEKRKTKRKRRKENQVKLCNFVLSTEQSSNFVNGIFSKKSSNTVSSLRTLKGSLAKGFYISRIGLAMRLISFSVNHNTLNRYNHLVICPVFWCEH